MEVDRVAEVLSIPIGAGHLLDPLDPSVDRLGSSVRHVRRRRIDHALPVLLDHPSDSLDRLEARADDPRMPLLPHPLGPATAHVVPDQHRRLLDRPRARRRRLLDPGHLIPHPLQTARQGAHVRLLEPVDHQRLEQRREPRSRIRPRHRDLPHAVLVALHARHRGDQERPVLHGVQMTPAPLPSVVAGAGPVALRAAKLRAGAAVDEDPHLLVGMGNLDPRDLPGALQADQPRVMQCDRRVGHPGKISPFPGRLPRPKRQAPFSAPTAPLELDSAPHETGKSLSGFRIGR